MGIKRLPWEEMQKRREQGLCYNCDEKFTPGSSDEELSKNSDIDEAEISVHAMADVRGPRTVKLNSWIKGKRVAILIDNGSTHNFLNQEIARKLHLDAEQIDPFFVKVASGEKLLCDTIYKNVPIKMQGVMIYTDLFALSLGGLDAVLGIQLLEELGEIKTDYKAGTMTLRWGDGNVTLTSRIDEQLKEVGIQSLARMWQKGGQCYALRVEEINTNNEPQGGK